MSSGRNCSLCGDTICAQHWNPYIVCYYCRSCKCCSLQWQQDSRIRRTLMNFEKAVEGYMREDQSETNSAGKI